MLYEVDFPAKLLFTLLMQILLLRFISPLQKANPNSTYLEPTAVVLFLIGKSRNSPLEHLKQEEGSLSDT
jgi:hypothetical protein